MHYDLCLTWYWEYDADFVQMLEAACTEEGLSLWQVTPHNLVEAMGSLYSGEITLGTLLHRATDDPAFTPFTFCAQELGTFRINPQEISHWAEDKATMHLELIAHGIETPYTIILAPFTEQPILPALDLGLLGEHFVIKPAAGGGGEGVIMHVSSLAQVLKARTEFANQKYLLQAHIQPQELEGRKAWFRVYYVDGKIHPCWWDPESHLFTPLNADDEERFGLTSLRQMTAKIASVCRLDWFSTEIAFSKDGKFVTVDYVNDGIDLRSQSKAQDGVPDEVIKAIAAELVALAARHRQSP
ncbi:MAG: hypothetical protein KJ638_04345 [Chloroflexi bacterium]|nr:hypothetical protein [Chloroflexota bacterium]